MANKEAIEHFRQMFKSRDRGGLENHFNSLQLEVLDIQEGFARMDLPFSDQLIGNPVTGTLASGPVMALLDSCCAMASATSGDTVNFSPTLDLRVDHLGMALPNETIHAEAEVYRHSRFIIFTRGIAYQKDKTKPIARCTINFTPIDQPVVKKNLIDSLEEAKPH